MQRKLACETKEHRVAQPVLSQTRSGLGVLHKYALEVTGHYGLDRTVRSSGVYNERKGVWGTSDSI